MTSLSKEHYGVTFQTPDGDAVDGWCEEIRLRGYALLPELLDRELVASMRASAVSMAEAFAADPDWAATLQALAEANQVRVPLVGDRRFLDALAWHPTVRAVCDGLLGGARGYYTLNQQNVVINRPGTAHNQARWHRDYPWFGTVGSDPIGLSFILALDDLTEANGGTLILPGSHRDATTPSDRYVQAHHVRIEAPAGSVIAMDSLIWHRTGINGSDRARIVCNTMIANPLLKPQIDIEHAMADAGVAPPDDPEIRRFLGFGAQPPRSWRAFVEARAGRQLG